MRLTSRGRLLLGASTSLVVLVAVVGAWQLAPDATNAHAGGTPAAGSTGRLVDDVVQPLPPVPAATRPTSRPAPAPPAATAAPRRTSGQGSGELVVVPGSSPTVGHGPLRRFTVEVERGLGEDPAAFAAAVTRTLGDARSWGRQLSFKRVSSGPVAFTVTLASPTTTDRLCRPLRTAGIYSCYNSRGRSVINEHRWRDGASSYAGHLAAYRAYVISHEVGHALGHGHDYSCRSDGRAPVMMQQTKSLYGCARNPWPFPPSEPED